MINTMNNENSPEERRHYKRLNKSFILKCFDKSDPTRKFEITQLKNISLGGICFPASQNMAPPTKLGVELKVPYYADFVYLEGVVLESKERVKGLIYEIRVQFDALSPKAEYVLTNIINTMIKGNKL